MCSSSSLGANSRLDFSRRAVDVFYNPATGRLELVYADTPNSKREG